MATLHEIKTLFDSMPSQDAVLEQFRYVDGVNGEWVYTKFTPSLSCNIKLWRWKKNDSATTHESPLNTQEGGTHYKKLAIQPVEYIHANSVPFLEGSAIKYLTRHKDKGGAADIKKAIHFCQLILSMEYNEDD